MIARFAYSPPRGTLAAVRPTVALGYLLAPAAIAMAFANPLVLGGCAVAVGIMARGAAATADLRRAVTGAVALGALIVAVNGLVVRRGDTVLFRGPDPPLGGPIDVTAEALVEGAVIGARVAIVIAAFAIITARVDPDYLLRSVRRFARRSALTATLLVRLVPLAVADFARLREARELRGPGASPVSRAAILRRLVSGTLDRAVDAAAALEVRGYGGPVARFVPRRRRGRFDRSFAITALSVVALAAAARFGGIGGFDPYPMVEVDADLATLGLALTIAAGSAVPFAAAARRSSIPSAAAQAADRRAR